MITSGCPANLRKLFVAQKSITISSRVNLKCLVVKMPVVLGAHAPLFAVDASYLMFQAGGLAGGELSTLDALANAVLLRFLAVASLNCPVFICAKRAAGVSARVAAKAKIASFMAGLLVFFHVGLDRAASAYGRNEPRDSWGVAGLAKSIFLRKGATLLGILCSEDQYVLCRSVLGVARATFCSKRRAVFSSGLHRISTVCGLPRSLVADSLNWLQAGMGLFDTVPLICL